MNGRLVHGQTLESLSLEYRKYEGYQTTGTHTRKMNVGAEPRTFSVEIDKYTHSVRRPNGISLYRGSKKVLKKISLIK